MKDRQKSRRKRDRKDTDRQIQKKERQNDKKYKIKVPHTLNLDDDEPEIVAKRLNESDPDFRDRKRVFGVFVHYSDCLKLDFHVLHPVVKISLIHLATGKPLPKSDRKKPVTSYYEGLVFGTT